MKFNSLFIAAISLTLLTGQDFTGVEFKTTKINDHMYVLHNDRGGNIGVCAGEDGVLLVDDQYAPLTEKLEAAIDEISKSDVKFVLNTHWHGDHTGANEHFGKTSTIIAHENVRKRLSTDQFVSIFGNVAEASPKAALPVITFNESLSIYFNNEEIDVIHFPSGHTDGDSVIFFRESNVVHMGDHFFNGAFPFIDLSSGGTVDGFMANVKTILDEVDEKTTIIPGHGPVGKKADLEAYYKMMQESVDHVRKSVREGQSLEAIIEEGFGGRWDDWGKGFLSVKQWIEIVYDDYY